MKEEQTPKQLPPALNSVWDYLKAFVSHSAWKSTVILFFSTFSMVFYMYLNPPLNPRNYFNLSQFIALPGDIPDYIVRFATATLFLGILPYLLCRILGFSNKQIGLRWDLSFFRAPVFWFFAGVLFVITVSTSLSSEVYNFYPWSKTLIDVVRVSPWYLLVHAVCYALFYYLPWETLFRGVLVFPLIHSATASEQGLERIPNIFALAAVQTMPTVLMHLPHPMVETLGAIPFGIICAYLSLKFRSILPTFFIHTILGVSVDTVIIIRHIYI